MPSIDISNPKFPTLAKPVRLGAIQARNKYVMASLTRNRSGTAGGRSIPNKDNIEYYRQRASGGIGLILTEGVLTSQMGSEWPFAPGIWSSVHMDAWKKIVDAVHSEGCPIVMQIFHVGRTAHPLQEEGRLSNRPVYAPSAIKARGGKHHELGNAPNEVPTAVPDPRMLVQEFRTAAQYAKEAGFDGVELHSANGYLVNEFLDGSANHRTDEWGGSIENRCRFGLECLKAFIDVFGADRVGIKINPCGGYNDVGMPYDEQLATFKYYIEQIDKLGLAYVQMVRYVEKMDPEYDGEKRAIQHDVYKTYSSLFKNTHLLLNGTYTAAEAEEVLEKGDAAGITFGIPTIGNPDAFEREQLGIELKESDAKLYYRGTEVNSGGYTDYPFASGTPSGKREKLVEDFKKL